MRIAATTARTTPNIAARWMPSTNALRATVVKRLGGRTGKLLGRGERAGERGAAPRRAPTAGSCCAASCKRLEYCDAAMLPSTAMPSAAPNSRVASFIAEPAPARLSGTADMIDAVIGDIDNDMPVISGARREPRVPERRVEAELA